MAGTKFVHGIGDSITNKRNTTVSDAVLALRQEQLEANAEMDRVWTTSGGVAGAPHSDLNIIHDGYMRQYTDPHGNIGRIYAQQDESGWHGFLVYGDIGIKYNALGGPDSWLGWPTSGESPFDEGGRVTTFQHGSIYWWLDTGAIELGNVVVRYSGLYCFKETDNDQLSNADEPYVIFGVIPLVGDAPPPIRTQVYQGVDNDESREDNIELYRGLPYGVMVSSVLMENDFGNPDQYKDAVQAGVTAASGVVVAALGVIPAVGPLLAVGAGAVLAKTGPAIAAAFNDLLDTGDDKIGQVQLVIRPKQMVTLTRAPQQDLKGILWQLDSPEIRGGGARYKTYFSILKA